MRYVYSYEADLHNYAFKSRQAKGNGVIANLCEHATRCFAYKYRNQHSGKHLKKIMCVLERKYAGICFQLQFICAGLLLGSLLTFFF